MIPTIKKHGLSLGVGIARFVPQSEFQMSKATMITNDRAKMPMLFVINPDGIVRHVKADLRISSRYCKN